MRICSQFNLESEFDCLRGIFRKNGYPSGIVERIMNEVKQRGIGKDDDARTELTQSVRILLKLLWIGAAGRKLQR